MDMSERGPSTVKEPETKRLKVDNNSKSKISEIITFISIHIAYFVLHKLKHQFWVFSQSLKVSGRPQTAYHSQKAHQRRQLLRMPRGDSGGLGCCRA